jgi:F-type H+-transporting ATPase subunit epsilon
MKLLVTTPISVIVEAVGVRHVRADDETGAFGILPGHADFITVLTVSVITWRNQANEEHYVAVRGGVLTVRDGNLVEVATREAVSEDTLRRLGGAVLERFREEAQAEEQSRVSAARLHLAAIRQLQRYLESGRQPLPQAPPPALGTSTVSSSLTGGSELS